jgi:hypothetical protein
LPDTWATWHSASDASAGNLTAGGSSDPPQSGGTNSDTPWLKDWVPFGGLVAGFPDQLGPADVSFTSGTAFSSAATVTDGAKIPNIMLYGQYVAGQFPHVSEDRRPTALVVDQTTTALSISPITMPMASHQQS